MIADQQGIVDLVKQMLLEGRVDAVLMPAKVPAGDSFAYHLIADASLLEDALPLPPIMPVQGARALSNVTRRGRGSKRIAAVMRPCEVRATVELYKIGQVDLDNVLLIGVDCPGALPLSDWFGDQRRAEDIFQQLLRDGDSDGVRPVCRICDHFSITGGEDWHVGMLGRKDILVIPQSPKGKDLFLEWGISSEDISSWKQKVDELTEERKQRRSQYLEDLRSQVTGQDGLMDTFSKCINCHNCMRVCPICYCRQCFFDSDNSRFDFEDYLGRAQGQGMLRLPPDTMLFHLGRMLHMSLSCVSCGACEDACPMTIPVAQVFSLVGEQNQRKFNYLPGENREESPPLRVYQEDELHEVERP